ncbi:hypothetical protein [Thiobacillus sp.]|uniref:hypothetical protein n=1 Tax=Thiobacillus sp. TaxID=924 RepID=UPI0025FAEFD5|nr:hypothetical protein [Thiobacillus sp.]
MPSAALRGGFFISRRDWGKPDFSIGEPYGERRAIRALRCNGCPKEQGACSVPFLPKQGIGDWRYAMAGCLRFEAWKIFFIVINVLVLIHCLAWRLLIVGGLAKLWIAQFSIQKTGYFNSLNMENGNARNIDDFAI